MKQIVTTYVFLAILIVSAIELNAQDVITIEPININTTEREYSPVYYKNGIVFSGTNRNSEGLTYVDNESGEQLTDLYYAPLNEETFGLPTLFSKNLKTSFHDGPITFSSDGNTAYFTRNIQVKKKLKNSVKVQNKLGVYKATYNGSEWINITPCFFNSADYNVGQPCLSPDGKKLYVVSDKEGGYGGIDIYYSEIIDGFCGSLVNLGSQINSESNEMFPFIDANNKLYFSSDKKSGYGGLDIYISKLHDNKWNEPYIMDTTINSVFDDFAIVYNETETEGYFCSNRAGSDDIYKIKVNYPKFGECEELVNELLCYEFFEEATLNADSVAMIYEWVFGDGNKERSLETYHCYEKAGSYIVELNIMDPLIGKNFINEATYELDIEEVIQPEIICPDTISINTEFTVKVKQGKWKAFEIGNYYLDYGDSITHKNSRLPYKYETGGFKELKILITGYDKETKSVEKQCFYKTIFVGSDTTILADQKKFIDELDYSSFNSEKLSEIDDSFYALEIYSSQNSVLNDSATLKQFVHQVREIYDEKSNNYSYSLGNTNNPFNLIEEFRNAHQLGFDNAIVKSYSKDSIKVEDLGIVYNDSVGEVSIILNNIHFEYDGYNLDKNSKIELQKLIDYLKNNKTIKIEIGAHTDASRRVEKAKKIFKAKGLTYTKKAHDKMSRAYNLKLSQQRAKSVVEYIFSQGVNKNRLKAVGYGEKQPIATNDTVEGQAKNRRVEFKVIHR